MCGAPGSRSVNVRATGGEDNLTTWEDDYDEGEDNGLMKKLKRDVCHPADALMYHLSDDEYSRVVCHSSYHIGKYKDEVTCDIVDMDACHILLGRPWEYDVNAIHKGKENTYSFIINGVKKVLVPLIDKNKSKDSEATRNNMMILNHGDFNDQIKGESVIYAVVATGTIQEGSSIPKRFYLCD
ncbi:hypothetical protein Tco_0990414 [Tanacetum coccineum]|uniref:Uncharacterized protein n=1 Tax=Tanacetum coccineum TaxID=301880 RepID=A0ABQ5EWP5_9ASTR